uniref:RNase H type-1 domain-containing protein n=1 Tax=Oryza punctata TaxID=4537 RepID=A0A0E0JV09_ORYPU
MMMLNSLMKVAQLVIVETNAANLRRAITSQYFDCSPYSALFKKIRAFFSNNFDHFFVSVCPISCNKVADCLSSYGAFAAASGSSCSWSQAPEFVTSLVSGDLPGASG